MSEQIKQENRLLHVETPFGKDVLQLVQFRGRETLGQPFQYQLTMISEDVNLDPNKIVGKSITFKFELQGKGEWRPFNGYVSRFWASSPQKVGTDKGEIREYKATIVPWIWFLGKTTDCRIFQNKTLPEIIEQIFSEYGVSKFTKNKLSNNYPKHEYCVQYRETDLNFVTRLMQEAGISYFCEHKDNEHILHLCDDKSDYQPCAESSVEFHSGSRANDHIFAWEKSARFPSGKYTQRAFNFTKPSTDLTTKANGLSKVSETSNYEVYDYPGEYFESADGKTETKIRMEEMEVDENTFIGSSHCRSFFAGGTFKLDKYIVKEEAKKEFLITSMEIYAEDRSQTNAEFAIQDFSNTFTCIPKSVPFRQKRTAKKPHINGVQTAIVTGPSSDEIYVDEYGRIKVQFHWDREGKKDENSSCWIRVAQNWAGKNWGIVFHPRVGQEVIIDFIEGDPDRPIVTGRVYNGEQGLPYDCPTNKTQSGVKTRSSKSGGTSNFNELRFEDKKGSEEIYFHAEKNYTQKVENDSTITIDHDLSTSVGNNETRQVKKNRTTTIGKDDLLSIKENRTTTVGKNEVHSVKGDCTTNVDGNNTLTINKNNTLSVNKDESNNISGNRSSNIGKNETIDAGQNLTAKAGQNLTIEAGQSITIKAGSAEIKLSSSGEIALKGMQLKIQGTTVDLNGSAKVGIKGGIVTLN